VIFDQFPEDGGGPGQPCEEATQKEIAVIVLKVLIGIVLLLVGRKLFWFFVAAMGFIVAMDLMVRLFPGPEAGAVTLVALVAGLATGVIGALLAIFLQQVSVGVAGFLAGGYVVLSLLDVFGLGEMTILTWVLAFVGAVAGLVLALALLEWALIVLSSLSGAGLIAQSIDLSRPVATLAFVVALGVGIVVQARMLREERSEGGAR
jgi:hypothetical protein